MIILTNIFLLRKLTNLPSKKKFTVKSFVIHARSHWSTEEENRVRDCAQDMYVYIFLYITLYILCIYRSWNIILYRRVIFPPFEGVLLEILGSKILTATQIAYGVVVLLITVAKAINEIAVCFRRTSHKYTFMDTCMYIK